MKKRRFRRPGYDPAESKHRFCDPGACHCCEDRGGGNFFCRYAKVMVVGTGRIPRRSGSAREWLRPGRKAEMGKLIDPLQLKKQETVLWDPALGFCECVLVEDIDNAPAVDAVEVVHGRWEKAEYYGFLRCSECKDVYIDDTWLADGKRNYCPSCGAKMDLEASPDGDAK